MVGAGPNGNPRSAYDAWVWLTGVHRGFLEAFTGTGVLKQTHCTAREEAVQGLDPQNVYNMRFKGEAPESDRL